VSGNPRNRMTRNCAGNGGRFSAIPNSIAWKEQVTVSNQDLKAAEARFRQARALVRFNRASEFPTISVAPERRLREGFQQHAFVSHDLVEDPFRRFHPTLCETRVQDTDVTVRRAAFEHTIAVLIGKPPAEFTLAPAPLNLGPPRIPVGVPSQLLERRPDIAAAERRVAEANQQIGIARAAYFPTVTLEGAAGFESTHIVSLLNGPNALWAVGPALAEALFDAGRRRATSQGAWANFDAVTANYRQTALTAFQGVEDNLAALRILEQEAQQQHEATPSAEDWLQVSMNRYTGGVDNYLQVTIAQTSALSNERNEADILRRRMDASVLLIKAVGGGWNISELPKEASLR
jgi:outer membrane protein TolC